MRQGIPLRQMAYRRPYCRHWGHHLLRSRRGFFWRGSPPRRGPRCPLNRRRRSLREVCSPAPRQPIDQSLCIIPQLSGALGALFTVSVWLSSSCSHVPPSCQLSTTSSTTRSIHLLPRRRSRSRRCRRRHKLHGLSIVTSSLPRQRSGARQRATPRVRQAGGNWARLEELLRLPNRSSWEQWGERPSSPRDGEPCRVRSSNHRRPRLARSGDRTQTSSNDLDCRATSKSLC